MKKLFFVWALLMASLFCYAATNGSVSDKEKERIKAEVKEVANALITGCEQTNVEMTCGTFYDSPDFRYINNGKILRYKDLVSAIKPFFDTLTGQKFTFLDEHYNILDRSIVIYTLNCKTVVNFKDGHTLLYDPAALQLTFKKIGKEWKAIVVVESTTIKNMENQQAEKLNQVELFKKYVTGMWECETGKDTLFNFDCKANGNYLEAKAWSTDANGNKFWENKNVIAYDKNSDKFIWSRTYKKGAANIFACWFSSRNVMEIIPINDLTNPAGAALKYRSEYLSPDLIKQTVTFNGKKTRVLNYSRIKDVKAEGKSEERLNQLELLSQFKGYWTGKIGKDTIEVWDGKAIENGIEANVRTMCKNKILTQGHTLLVYDPTIDKIIGTDMYKGMSPKVFTLCFTTKNSGEIIMIKDFSNPDEAAFKVLFDFRTPGEFKQTFLQQNKPILVKTHYLMKKK